MGKLHHLIIYKKTRHVSKVHRCPRPIAFAYKVVAGPRGAIGRAPDS